MWQEQNRDWWEAHPMRYDWVDGLGFEDFTPKFYEEIDRRFFDEVWKYMPWRIKPFDPLIDFGGLKSKDVLEIGVGSGTHAQLLAAHSKSYVGIDLTEYAVRSTTARLRHVGLGGRIIRMDAERLDFPDDSFDLIWTWGVIHHSSNTLAVLGEIRRVLRQGGSAVVMVYHRNVWNYYVMAGIFQGIILADLLKTKSLHTTLQKRTDGALARYYTIPEWRALTAEWFISDVRVYGGKAELFPLPSGRLKRFAMAVVPNALTRFLTNRCHFGTFLVDTMTVRK